MSYFVFLTSIKVLLLLSFMLGQELNNFIVTLNFGALVFLAFILFVNPTKVNKRGNTAFGLFILLWSSFWLEEIGELIGYPGLVRDIEVPLRFVQFLTIVFFYIAIAFYSAPKYKLFPKAFIHLISPIVYLIFTYYRTDDAIFPPFLNVFILVQCLFYCIVSFARIRKHKKNILSFASSTNEIDLNWLENIIKLLIALIVIMSIYEVIRSGNQMLLILNTISLITVYFVGLNVLKQKEIFFTEESKREEINTIIEEDFKEVNLIPDLELQIKMEKIELQMLEKKAYLDNDLNLIKLAALVSITPHQLSYTINQGFKVNFFQFVNGYRIEKAKSLLLDNKMNKYSILGIAYESGFNSKTTFYNTFKKITGETPTNYKERDNPNK